MGKARLDPEVRHQRWLARQQKRLQWGRDNPARILMNARNLRHRVPSARDLDAWAEEEKAREATRGLDPAKSNSTDLPVERGRPVRRLPKAVPVFSNRSRSRSRARRKTS
jgi:hypothetical protein